MELQRSWGVRNSRWKCRLSKKRTKL